MDKKFIRAFWYISNNFGDNLNHFLIKHISKLPAVYTHERNQPHYIVCGSILSEANKWSTVCGAGLGSEQHHVNAFAELLIVRGHMTADIMDSDALVGDPALLLPQFYNSQRKKKYERAIIPHWSDYEFMLSKSDNDVHIIDPFLPVKEFIDEVRSCEKVICSGLHGLIVADAYEVPNAWLDLSQGHFKCRDYYSTTENPKEPMREVDFDSCVVSKYKYSIDELLNAFPFYKR